jgi:hypothetical protein
VNILLQSLGTMKEKEYWSKENTVEFFSFVVKTIIIVPGLLFGISFWWLYLFALASSVSLIWSSTIKTIPTLIWFNMIWVLIAITYIIKYWIG